MRRSRRCARAAVRSAVLAALTCVLLLSPPPARLLAAGTGGGAGAGAGDAAGAPASPKTADAAGARASPEAPDAAGADVPAIGRAWPVGTGPAVLRGWEPPATPYGRGHRGVDLAAPAGTPVRAVAAGRVFFAGRVAGKGVLSVELSGTGDPPLRTTYEPVGASVREGDEVTAGEVIGVVEPGGSHCRAPCLHWGLRRAGTYLNPLALLPPWLLHRGPSRLLPVLGVPLPDGPA
ncbi:murein hydrolase activator EnvC family protein [Streptomyces composti]|uniref:murein hydrolase activator EnvC family protein n=1 Tax=Streptomyces composti TaxID=2720025 RepID=UPI001F1174EC|nr:M23 family metallopeptidase [Streptomyces composti]